MDKYEFNAINLIAEAFEARNVKFNVVNHQEAEQLMAAFSVKCGPNVFVRFISCDNDNDVAVRIYGLISNIPEEKKARVLEACNVINCKIRHMKFCMDSEADVNVEYDFPISIPDEMVGEVAFEIFVRMMRTLDAEYGIFMKALYSDEALTTQKRDLSSELRERLQRLRAVLEAQNAAAGASEEEFNLDDFEPEDATDGYD